MQPVYFEIAKKMMPVPAQEPGIRLVSAAGDAAGAKLVLSCAGPALLKGAAAAFPQGSASGCVFRGRSLSAFFEASEGRNALQKLFAALSAAEQLCEDPLQAALVLRRITEPEGGFAVPLQLEWTKEALHLALCSSCGDDISAELYFEGLVPLLAEADMGIIRRA